MPTITLEQVNNHKIKPIQVKTDTRPVKASEIYPDLYGNMFFIAKTRTGKTTVIHNIVPKMIGKKTKVIIFASTAYNDDLWISLRKQLAKKDIDVEVFTSIKDENGNHLKDLVTELTDEAKEREEAEGLDKEEEHIPTTEELLNEFRKQNGIEKHMDRYDPDEEVKPKKEKYQTPNRLIIFDDLSEELRSPYIAVLLKFARHFFCRILLSSQYLKDLQPSARMQIRGWILFNGLSVELLHDLHQSISVPMPFDVFYDLYKKSTADTSNSKKNFFYFLPYHFDFRRNLTHRWKIPKELFNDA